MHTRNLGSVRKATHEVHDYIVVLEGPLELGEADTPVIVVVD